MGLFLFILVVWALFVMLCYIFGGSSGGGNYFTDTHTSNYSSNTNYSSNKNNSWNWQPYVDPDDREYDSFGSYGTEDDLADWDENDDV